MDNTEAIKAISITAQRFIAVCDVQKYVDYLRSLGVSDEQMKSFCYDYIIANSDLAEEEGDD